MPYNINNFYCARGKLNCSASPTAAAIHTYTSTDSFLETAIPGYFPPYYGFDSEKIKDGDYVFFSLTGLSGIGVVVNAAQPQAGVFIIPGVNTLSQLFHTQSNSFDGIWASPQTVSIDYIQTGDIFQMVIPEILSTATVSSEITITTPPFRFPSIDITVPIVVVDNGVDVPGKITFTTNGSFTIKPLSSNFSGTGISGFYGMTFSYNELVVPIEFSM